MGQSQIFILQTMSSIHIDKERTLVNVQSEMYFQDDLVLSSLKRKNGRKKIANTPLFESKL